MLSFTPAVADRGVLGQDRDALLALEVHRVHHALGDVLVGAEGARLPEHGVDQRRLAVVDVGDDRHVADVLAERAHPAEASALSPTADANPARAIYGTILVMAVIAALSHDDSVRSAELIAGVLATTFVFWIAHVYAEVLG